MRSPHDTFNSFVLLFRPEPALFELSTTFLSRNMPSSDRCQVCRQPGHGFHFGVFICRACAAFFRRCHFSPRLSHKTCRVRSGICEPRNGKWLCKKCRLDKCRKLGMTVDNIQYGRDAHMSSESFSAKRKVFRVECMKSGAKTPLVLFREDNKNCRIAFVDMSALVEKAVQLIMTPNLVIKTGALSTLEQLSIGLDDYKSLQKKKLTKISLFSRKHQTSEWERKMLSAATWLNSCEAFRKLEGEVKMNILRGVWMLWGKLERVAMTAEMRRRGECEENQFVVSSTSMLDFDRISSDVSWRSNYSYQQLLFLLSPTERYYDSLIKELMEVHPDSTELTFLLCVICFQITGSHYKGETEEVCERLQEVVANDIHDYYEKKEKNNYAFRIQQLMRIKEHFFRLRFQRGEKYKVACQLDFIQLKVSNPEFFRLMC